MPLLEISQIRHISASVRLMNPPLLRSISTPLPPTHPQTMLWTKRSTMSSQRTATSRTF